VARRNYTRDQSGAAAVEFAFVGPVLVVMLIGICQFGMILHIQSEMAHVARNAARLLSVQSIVVADAPAYVSSKLPAWGGGYQTNVAMAADTYTVTVTIPTEDVAFFPFMEGYFGDSLSASASISSEEL
jgi:Flp pilus assembly protein TadG